MNFKPNASANAGICPIRGPSPNRRPRHTSVRASQPGDSHLTRTQGFSLLGPYAYSSMIGYPLDEVRRAETPPLPTVRPRALRWVRPYSPIRFTIGTSTIMPGNREGPWEATVRNGPPGTGIHWDQTEMNQQASGMIRVRAE